MNSLSELRCAGSQVGPESGSPSVSPTSKLCSAFYVQQPVHYICRRYKYKRTIFNAAVACPNCESIQQRVYCGNSSPQRLNLLFIQYRTIRRCGPKASSYFCEPNMFSMGEEMVQHCTPGLVCLFMQVFGVGTTPSRKHRRIRATCFTLLLLTPLVSWAEQPPRPPLSGQTIPGSTSRGELLFMGRIQFRNQGPACIACHSIGGVTFPNGGTLGPDLTNAYALLGQQGAHAAIQTLYFGVMTPIYDERPLLPDEQADLLAFLRQSEKARPPQWITQKLLSIAIVFAGILLLITAVLWRRRLQSVRWALVNRVRKQGSL